MSRLSALIDWLTPDDEEPVADVDTAFLLEHKNRSKCVSVFEDDPARCRCDLCGSQYALEEFPQLVEHVAAHDDQVGDDIDPFAEPEVIAQGRIEDIPEWSADADDAV